MSRMTAAIVGLGLATFLAQPNFANAADINLWTARALATVLAEVGPQFERTTGHRLTITVGLPPEFVKRARAGEPFDVMITGATQLDALIESGVINPATRTDIARSGIGVEVRAGAPRPDISSVEAFKRALLEARSIAYLKDVGSGVYIADLLERLGIADAVRSKVTRPDSDIVSELVARGEIEIGMVVITQILTTPGVELVGPLPQDIQSYVLFTAGVSTRSKAPKAAEDLIRFLTGPIAAPIIKAQGMEPSAPSPALRATSPSGEAVTSTSPWGAAPAHPCARDIRTSMCSRGRAKRG
jgi:molybdate transport system substrate-binding protein